MGSFLSAIRSRPFLAARIAISVTSLSAALILGYYRRGHAFGASNVAAEIDRKAAQLAMKAPRLELTSEKALRARAAIKQGDYASANTIVADVLANSHLENWRFSHVDKFMSGIIDVNDPAFEAHLDTWVSQAKSQAIPLLIRAEYHYDKGWFKRGHRFSSEVQPDDLAFFAKSLQLAAADIDAALGLSDQNPYAFNLKLRILQGQGSQQDLMTAFEAAIAKYPNYYRLYDIALSALQPKWGGAIKTMYTFVDHYAGGATEYSPLKLLYVDLYQNLLSAASAACNAYSGDQRAACVRAMMDKIVTPDLQSQVLAALKLYDHTDKYQFGVALGGIIANMQGFAGGEAYAGGFLELVADSMHSDTQLKQDKPGHNSYIIDAAVAASWYAKGFYDNALKKDREALTEIDAAAFPNEEEKDLALANVYEDMSRIFNKGEQYRDMIAYEKAAVVLGGQIGRGHYACFGYYKLGDYDAAIRACTQTAEMEPENLQVSYWRARAYQDLGQTDAALRDYMMLANSEDDYRTSGAIEASMIYFNRNDIRNALNIYNKFTYLYNQETTSRDDIAVSYNNRCYAYMQLGQLKEALEDCNASLKFGSLPDAFRKQQQLIKRLSVNQTGL